MVNVEMAPSMEALEKLTKEVVEAKLLKSIEAMKVQAIRMSNIQKSEAIVRDLKLIYTCVE